MDEFPSTLPSYAEIVATALHSVPSIGLAFENLKINPVCYAFQYTI